jgi:DNA-binding NtrC family response regulator
MPLVVVNCGALPEGILESELFGHERGAFTGAQYRHKGKFELAHGGTLFLDEVGELSPRIQVELLRVLEEKKVVRLGGTEPIEVDFRLIAATNKDLRDEMRAGRFREDLFYRLHVFTIFVPPLRERTADIGPLARAFAQRFAARLNRPVPEFDESALRVLTRYPWAGNVRELANVVEQAVVSQPGPVIGAYDLSISLDSSESTEAAPTTLATIERRHVERMLEDTHWNISETARLLNVDRKTVYHKIRQYGLRKEQAGG